MVHAAAPVSPAPDRSRYVLGVLCAVYAFNHLDRQVFAVLVEPIKTDLGLSDSAMGFLGGLSFALFYALAGLPIARMADRGSRKAIISAGIVIWSAATMASGLARSFAQLAVARVVTAVGEASNAPASQSMISDYFPPYRRATALAIFYIGAHIGVLIGFTLGGWIAQELGWRAAFIILGSPGLLLALLVWRTVPEPERGAAESASVDTSTLPWRQVISFLRRSPGFALVLLGQGIHAFSLLGIMMWTAPLLMRLHGMGVAEAGLWLGPITGIAGALGVLAGGRLADRLGKRDARWYVRVPALTALVGLPFTVAFIMSGSTTIALLCLIPHQILGSMTSGPIAAVLQAIVPVRMRALAVALSLLAANLIGLGLGPQLVGVLSDLLRESVGDQSLRYGMLVAAVANLLGGAAYLAAGRWIRGESAAQDPARTP